MTDIGIGDYFVYNVYSNSFLPRNAIQWNKYLIKIYANKLSFEVTKTISIINPPPVLLRAKFLEDYIFAKFQSDTKISEAFLVYLVGNVTNNIIYSVI